VERLAHELIVPWRGTGFAREHLVWGRKDMGFSTPMRDLWASNMTALLEGYDFTNFLSLAESPVHWLTDYNDPDIDTQKEHAAYALLKHYSNWEEGTVFVPPPKMYHHLIEAGYGDTSRHDKKRKISMHTPDWTPEESDLLTRRFDKLRAAVPSHVLNTHSLITYNSLPTNRRCQKAFKLKPRRTPLSEHDQPCLLCDKEEDTWSHLISDRCEVFVDLATQATDKHFPEEDPSTFCTRLPAHLMHGLPAGDENDSKYVPSCSA
jgi:hypothetical protein